MQETQVRSLGQEDSLEKEMAIHSSTIAWRIPWTEEPGRLQSMGSQRVRHDWTITFSFFLSFGPRVTLGSKDKLTSKVINSSIQSISVILSFKVINLYLVLSLVPRSHSQNPWNCLRVKGKASLVAQRVKHLPAIQETHVWSLGQKDPLEEEMATHCSTLAWRIPWME